MSGTAEFVRSTLSALAVLALAAFAKAVSRSTEVAEGITASTAAFLVSKSLWKYEGRRGLPNAITATSLDDDIVTLATELPLLLLG